MATITSRHNPLIKRVKDAIREHADEIVIEGPKAVDDAIAGGWKPIVALHRGVDISNDYPELGNALLVCATETRTAADIKAYADALAETLKAAVRAA